MHSHSHAIAFLRSALTPESPRLSTVDALAWLSARRAATRVNVRPIPFAELDQWAFDADGSALRHASGRFFSIEGIRVRTTFGDTPEWDQPILNQPEVGLLGILAREIDGVLHLLMQAKIEPGNVGAVQLSPTLQATKSNFTQVHGGRKPLFLEHFLNPDPRRVLLDQLQSEQGARFLRKRNRNIIVQVADDVAEKDLTHDNFRWLTLGQISTLLRHDNVVNMDTRTVVSGIPYGTFSSDVIDFYSLLQHIPETALKVGLLRSVLDGERGLHRTDDIISWMTRLKAHYDLSVESIPLTEVRGWQRSATELRHTSGRFFEVIAASVEIEGREVQRWTQPLLKPASEGLCAFVMKEIDGLLHVLVQAKVEPGNLDILEMAPTVQTITGNYRDTGPYSRPQFLDYVLDSLANHRHRVRYEVLQSEEGGRFWLEQNRNVLIESGEELPIEVPENYMWMTLNQLKTFIRFNNYLNIQARSLLSTISFV
jgi:dTDP-4-dehydro-6-deoxy-alpha-D-glucopyranose 2,3-dehydratase